MKVIRIYKFGEFMKKIFSWERWYHSNFNGSGQKYSIITLFGYKLKLIHHEWETNNEE